MLIADGFSCRHQIAGATHRQAMHLAQVLKMALDSGPTGPVGGYPEVRYPAVQLDGSERLKKTVRMLIFGGLCLAGGVALAIAARQAIERKR